MISSEYQQPKKSRKRYFMTKISLAETNANYKLAKIKLYETPTSFCEVEG